MSRCNCLQFTRDRLFTFWGVLQYPSVSPKKVRFSGSTLTSLLGTQLARCEQSPYVPKPRFKIRVPIVGASVEF